MSYNLISLLNSYKSHVIPLSGDPSEAEFHNLENRLLNVIAIGLRHFNTAQADALCNFSAELVQNKADNLYTRIVKVLSENPIFLYYAKSDPDIRTLIHCFRDVSEIKKLPIQNRLRIGSYAINRVLAAGDKDPQPEISTLLQLSKIVCVLWNHPFTVKDKDKLYDKYNRLIGMVNGPEGVTPPSLTAEFNKAAKTIIKLQESKYVPEEINHHIAFHGKALSQGLEKAKAILSSTNKADYDLTSFSLDYCEAHLQPFQYLIRPSTTVTNIVDPKLAFSYFTFTITYKPEDKKPLGNYRFTKITDLSSCKITWKAGIPAECNFSESKSFDSLKDMIGCYYGAYTPSSPPSDTDLHKYVIDMYGRIE